MGTSAQKLRTAPTTAGAVRVPTARAAVAAAVAIISFACEGGSTRDGYWQSAALFLIRKRVDWNESPWVVTHAVELDS